MLDGVIFPRQWLQLINEILRFDPLVVLFFHLFRQLGCPFVKQHREQLLFMIFAYLDKNRDHRLMSLIAHRWARVRHH